MAEHHHLSTHGFHTAVDVKLNGDNYQIWAGSVRLILFGLDLLSHIDGSIPEPASSEGFGAPLLPPLLVTLVVPVGIWMIAELVPSLASLWSLLYVRMSSISPSPSRCGITSDRCLSRLASLGVSLWPRS